MPGVVLLNLLSIFRVINNPSLTKSLQSLPSPSGCRSFHFLSIFLLTLLYENIEYYSWSSEVCSINHSTQSHHFQATQTNPQTLSYKSSFVPKTSHKLYLTNLHLFQKLLSYGTNCRLLLSPNPATYHPSNLTSADSILSLYLLNLFPFSLFFFFFGALL